MFYTTTAALNLRKQPVIANGNVLCVMPPDTVVEELDNTPQCGFRNVRTIIDNATIEGFASDKFLAATNRILERNEPLTIPKVHLPTGDKLITRNGTGRAFPLTEKTMPKIDLREMPPNIAERSKAIHDVLDFLAVEKSARYAPNSKNTFCNIYAYDVAYCLGAYLPRVWWTANAIAQFQKGQKPAIIYEKTVEELTANYITNWFGQYGESFGWRRQFTISDLQKKVNAGALGIIVAQRINMNNPGHIVAVVPETTIHTANRSAEGVVISPLQSQAGRSNRQYLSANPWWEDKTRFKKWGFWIFP